jgi:hypothetical protein
MNDLSNDDIIFLKDILGDDEDSDIVQSILLPLLPTQRRESTAISSYRSCKGALAPANGPVTKCGHIFVGGTQLPAGCATDVNNPFFCSNLFCISCDHMVVRFADRRWKPSTDYLFLRNNYPERVHENLVRAPRWCAYCCQCTFRSENQLKKLPLYSGNWVCPVTTERLNSMQAQKTLRLFGGDAEPAGMLHGSLALMPAGGPDARQCGTTVI